MAFQSKDSKQIEKLMSKFSAKEQERLMASLKEKMIDGMESMGGNRPGMGDMGGMMEGMEGMDSTGGKRPDMGDMSDMFGNMGSTGGKRPDMGDMSNMFGSMGSSGGKKPRQKRNIMSMAEDEMEGMMGMMEADMDDGEKIAMMGSMGLQGFLMMGKRDTRKMPRALRDMPECLTQLLWAPEEAPSGTLCSKLPSSFREKIRQVMMMVLKKDLPERLLKMDWKKFGKVFEESEKDLKKVAQSAMTKMILPLEANDIEELVFPVKNIVKKMEELAEGNDEKEIFQLVSNLVGAMDKKEVYDSIAVVAKDIQGYVLLGKSKGLMTGKPGPAPDLTSLCETYATYFLDVDEDRERVKRSEFPTTWTERNGTIFKSEFCPLSRKWMWSKVARCACDASYPGTEGGNMWTHPPVFPASPLPPMEE